MRESIDVPEPVGFLPAVHSCISSEFLDNLAATKYSIGV